jgi:PHD/YefM family antitoxin component YafN of YafNO toxin-antitoxin module
VYTWVDTTRIGRAGWLRETCHEGSLGPRASKPGQELIQGKEIVLVTRRGKPAAMLLPLKDSKLLSLELRRQLYLELSADIGRQIEAKGITADEIQRDFEETRKRRRRR